VSAPTPAQTACEPDEPLEIVAAWQLADMQPSVAGIQYGAADNAGRNDDDMAQAGLQVSANINDLPEPRRIEYWLVTTAGEDGSPGPRVAVQDPSGQQLTQLDTVQRHCADLAGAQAGGTSLEAAIATGQVSAANDDLLARCYAGQVDVYSTEGRLGINDLAGEYAVDWVVGGDADEQVSIEVTFENLAVFALEINFEQIDFGAVQPDTRQEASYRARAGNPIASTPAIRNLGNTDGYLALQFSPMVGAKAGDTIAEFGASLGTERIDPIVAGVETCFTTAIEPNETNELRLFLHPGAVAADTYAGELKLGLRGSCGL
jgi:hypothetical protein